MSADPMPVRARMLRGPQLLETLGSALDELHAATGVPITSRRAWLDIWIRCNPGFEPWGFVVEADGGRLEAAVLLARRRARGLLDVVALGHGPSDYVRMPARTEHAASLVAEAAARALRSMRMPWRLRVEQLPTEDPVARRLQAMLPVAELAAGDPSPVIRFGPDRSLDTYLSKNARGARRRSLNRAKRDGVELRFRSIRDPADVASLLPEVERIRRERDAALARRSDLADPRGSAFWRGVILELARRGELELTLLSAGPTPIAFMIGLLDGRSYRMWDGRFQPDWGWYGPGRLADSYAVGQALEDPRFEEFDWMRGLEDYKLHMSTDLVQAEHLRAWSSHAIRMVTESPRRGLQALRRMKDEHPAVQRAWVAVKRRTIARPGADGRSHGGR